MEWVAGENPKDLLSLSKGVSENITQASDKQKLEAKSRLLDLVFTNDIINCYQLASIFSWKNLELKLFYMGKSFCINFTS